MLLLAVLLFWVSGMILGWYAREQWESWNEAPSGDIHNHYGPYDQDTGADWLI